MLHAGGAEVVAIGFRRVASFPSHIEGASVIDLGRTHDGRMLQRAGMVALRRFAPGSWRKAVAGADVVMARNLEMLALAHGARARCAPKARLVYECLDVHRLMIGENPMGRALRALERHWMKTADLLVVSSPAFVERHFAPRQGVGRTLDIPVLLVENKMLSLGAEESCPEAGTIAPGPPWRIGWFGMIRCRRSLDLLCDLARRRPGLLQVIIRGRPARSEFADFDAQIRDTPGISFGGSYGAGELGPLYGDVHFNWTVDYFEAGANSDWLLPNRIYEGGAFGAIPIARAGTESADWLHRAGIGVALNDPARDLEPFLDSLTAEKFSALACAARKVPRHAFVATSADCQQLVRALLSCCRSATGNAIADAPQRGSE
jgi:hypothetical protein